MSESRTPLHVIPIRPMDGPSRLLYRAFAKLLRTTVKVALKRDVVLVPDRSTSIVFQDAPAGAVLPLRYTYRASGDGLVTYQMQTGGAELSYRLYPATFSGGQVTRGSPCLSLSVQAVEAADQLRVSLVDQRAWINQTPLTPLSRHPSHGRKFIAHLALTNGAGTLSRACSHYLPFDGKPIHRDYYFGDDYVNYPQQVAVSDALTLVRRHCSAGRLLDVGCALGIYTKGFLDAGFDAYGIDISEFAVDEAASTVGAARVARCNLDVSSVPFEGTFDVVWMWDVLEHSVDPKRMLAEVTERVSRGSWLFLQTSNSESLTHRIFEADWEVYSDYSHYGAKKVNASNVGAWLRQLGWRIVDWKCSDVWVEGTDPVALRLQEAFRRLPELALLLSERDLGDFIVAVARKE